MVTAAGIFFFFLKRRTPENHKKNNHKNNTLKNCIEFRTMEKPLGTYDLQECHISNLQFFHGAIQFYSSYAELLTFTSERKKTSELFIPYQELLYFKVVKSQHVIHIALPNDYILQWVSINASILQSVGSDGLQDLSSETGMDNCRYPMAMRFVHGPAMEHFIQHMVPHLKRDRESRSFSRMSISTLIPARNGFSHPSAQLDQRIQEGGYENAAHTSTGGEIDVEHPSQDSFRTNNDYGSSVSSVDRSLSEEEERITEQEDLEESSWNHDEETVSPQKVSSSHDASVSTGVAEHCAASPMRHSQEQWKEVVEDTVAKEQSTFTSLPLRRSEEGVRNASIATRMPSPTQTTLVGSIENQEGCVSKEFEEHSNPARIYSRTTYGYSHWKHEDSNLPVFPTAESESVNIESQMEAMQLPVSPVRFLRRHQDEKSNPKPLDHHTRREALNVTPFSSVVSPTSTLKSIASSHEATHTPKGVRAGKRGRPQTMTRKGTANEKSKMKKREITPTASRRKVHVTEVEVSSDPSLAVAPSHLSTPSVSTTSHLLPRKESIDNLSFPVFEEEQKLETVKREVAREVPLCPPFSVSISPFSRFSSTLPLPAELRSSHHCMTKEKKEISAALKESGTPTSANAVGFNFNDVVTLPHQIRNIEKTVKTTSATFPAAAVVGSQRSPSSKWVQQTTNLNSFLLRLMGNTTKENKIGEKKAAPKSQRAKKGTAKKKGDLNTVSSEKAPQPTRQDHLFPSPQLRSSAVRRSHSPLPPGTLSSLDEGKIKTSSAKRKKPEMRVGSGSNEILISKEETNMKQVMEKDAFLSKARLHHSAGEITRPSIEEECAATLRASASSSSDGITLEKDASGPVLDGKGGSVDIALLHSFPSSSLQPSYFSQKDAASSRVACDETLPQRSVSKRVFHPPTALSASLDRNALKEQRIQQAMLSLNRISYYLQVIRESEDEVRGLLLVLAADNNKVM